MSDTEMPSIVHKFVTKAAGAHTEGMATLIVLRPRKRSFAAGLRASVRDIVSEFIAFERTHTTVAWGATLAGLAIGLALQALG